MSESRVKKFPQHKELDVLLFEKVSEMDAWLRKNHQQQESVWLLIVKKASDKKSVSYEEARETAIRYGWIDGLINAYDDDFYALKFSLRRPRSKWSKINRGIAQELIKEGKMKPSGLEQVERAKADGRWDAAYDSPKNMKVPDYFIKAIKKNKAAYTFFKTLNRANTYAVASRLNNAKRQTTKDRLVKKFVEMFARGEKLY